MGLLGDVMRHPSDFVPLLQVYMLSREARRLPQAPSFKFCYSILNRVSRSFAIVICNLRGEIRDAVCIFYLVLRALDTVEDDMALPDEKKLPLLLSFHTLCYDRGFSMDDCGTGDYKELMEKYPLVVDAFLKLSKPYQDVIVDITKRMGAGMHDFIEKDEVKTIKDYNLYCHYVAGLVGVGLSNLFAMSKLEDPKVFASPNLDDLSNSMGLFLQKTNIIRDYLEDIMEEPAPRMFWPREIWGKYAKELDEFKLGCNREKAVECLNHMVCNALSHATDALTYMSKLREKSVFAFCAIPQVMAIGTLAVCYNNGEVFERVVKLRKGLSAQLMVKTKSMEDVYRIFLVFARDIGSTAQTLQMKGSDPTVEDVLKAVDAIEEACEDGLKTMGLGGTMKAKNGAGAGAELDSQPPVPIVVRLFVLFFCVGYILYAWNADAVRVSYGVRPGAAGPMADMVHKLLSLPVLFYAVTVGILGKRIGSPEPDPIQPRRR